jgi:hypothetical protein
MGASPAFMIKGDVRTFMMGDGMGDARAFMMGDGMGDASAFMIKGDVPLEMCVSFM